jgi:hypothetical protein
LPPRARPAILGGMDQEREDYGEPDLTERPPGPRTPTEAGRRGKRGSPADITKLAGACLDALDWLYDRQCSAADVCAVLAAAREDLKGTAHAAPFDRPVAELLAVTRSAALAEVQRDRALEVTDDLRHYLDGLLPTE